LACFFERTIELAIYTLRDELSDPSSSLTFYFHFEFPFDILNAALIAHFFHWIDSYFAFKSLLSFENEGVDGEEKLLNKNTSSIESEVCESKIEKMLDNH
jgi:hypothetical protein